VRIEPIAARVSELAQSKPAIVASGGSVAGFGGGLVVLLDHFTRVFQFFAVFFGALGAFIAFLLVLPRLIRFLRAWKARGLLAADKE
jgi:hypothetical protein